MRTSNNTVIQISNELIRDANPSAENILRGNAATYMGLDQGWQILLGNGLGGTPVGLYSATNVTKGNGTNGGGFNSAGTLPSGLGTNSKFPTIGDLTTAIFNVEDINGSTNVPIGQTNCTGIVGPVILKLGVTSATNVELVSGGTDQRPLYDFGYNQMRWANRVDGSSSLDGFLGVPTWVLTNTIKKSLASGTGSSSTPPTVVTTNPLNSPPSTSTLTLNNMSPVFFGDWKHVWVMERSDIEIMTSSVAGTAFQNDQTSTIGVAA